MNKLSLAVAAVALSSCSGGENLDLADKAVERFHQQLNAGEFNAIYTQASPALRSATSQGDLIKLLTAIRSKLGPFKSGTRNSWRVNYGTNANTVILFDSTYERGKAQETFTFENEPNAPLIGYNINSPTLVTG